MLCGRFLAEAARELGLDAVQEIARDAMDALRERDWRGNIRELRHVVKGAALRARGGTIRREHLGDPLQSRRKAAGDPVASPGAGTWKERLDQQEAMALQETLDRAGGNLTKGAELFGVPRTTYREKLLRHGLLSRD